jgi:hypothetical protein
MSDPTIPQDVEDALWRDAWRIAWIGAANPTAVAHTLATHLGTLTHIVGTADAGRHLALQAIGGHLAFLMHMEGYALGPSDESIKAVQSNAKRLGLDV